MLMIIFFKFQNLVNQINFCNLQRFKVHITVKLTNLLEPFFCVTRFLIY